VRGDKSPRTFLFSLTFITKLISINPKEIMKSLKIDAVKQLTKVRWLVQSKIYFTTISFQRHVGIWLRECLGEASRTNKKERNHRFLEEAVELVQATAMTREEAYFIVDDVFDRPPGDPSQEVGGVMVSLAALCSAQNIDMRRSGKTELRRVWRKIPLIRAKQACKPKL
jgi:hypothetical protein